MAVNAATGVAFLTISAPMKQPQRLSLLLGLNGPVFFPLLWQIYPSHAGRFREASVGLAMGVNTPTVRQAFVSSSVMENVLMELPASTSTIPERRQRRCLHSPGEEVVLVIQSSAIKTRRISRRGEGTAVLALERIRKGQIRNGDGNPIGPNPITSVKLGLMAQSGDEVVSHKNLHKDLDLQTVDEAAFNKNLEPVRTIHRINKEGVPTLAEELRMNGRRRIQTAAMTAS